MIPAVAQQKGAAHTSSACGPTQPPGTCSCEPGAHLCSSCLCVEVCASQSWRDPRISWRSLENIIPSWKLWLSGSE